MGKKKRVQNLKWATAHLSRRLGAGRARHAGWARRRGSQAGARELGRGTGPRGVRQAGAGRAGHTPHRRWAHGRWVRARGAGVRPRHASWDVGCALGALSLFLTRFDSVLFLSQFLDTVHEPGSRTLFITKKFRKKIFFLNKIKLDKIFEK